MAEILCPVCGGILERQEGALRCGLGHSFDIARQGYYNLLTVSQKRSLHPGDTREMVAARRRFLDTGAYAPIGSAICELLKIHGAGDALLDVGCGEGYYTAKAAESLTHCEFYGIDVSKDAVRYASARYKSIAWLCGTAARLPFGDGSFSCLMSIFSLTVPGEFHRVLRENGIFLQVLAGEDHLLNLKRIIYPELHRKEKLLHPDYPGFQLIDSRELSFSFSAEGAEVQDLLSMTPHVWRISREGVARLRETERLSDRAQVVLNVFHRK